MNIITLEGYFDLCIVNADYTTDHFISGMEGFPETYELRDCLNFEELKTASTFQISFVNLVLKLMISLMCACIFELETTSGC